MTVEAISVSQLNAYIKRKFDADMMLQSQLISGEISNFSPHYRTGHLYFSLKDASSSIKAVMFARQAARLRFVPENGMKVLAVGRIGVFERDGVYQVYVEELAPDGAGALAVAFEQLKKKLEAEGLFDPSRKKALPRYPKKIGVITSPEGAAIQDILNITSRRWPLSQIVLAPVTVQGPLASSEMIRALKAFNRQNAADVILLGRGGGSAEDLWCFNDETLARAIFDSSIPVVSAVGHETDFTIADFVADLRAPTPSAAAELVTPDISDEILMTDRLYERLQTLMLTQLSREKLRLDALLSRRSFSDPEHFFDIEKKATDNRRLRLLSGFQQTLRAQNSRVTANAAKLESLNPLSVLLRGYSLTLINGGIVHSVNGISPGDTVVNELSDGKIVSRVTEIIKRDAVPETE